MEEVNTLTKKQSALKSIEELKQMIENGPEDCGKTSDDGSPEFLIAYKDGECFHYLVNATCNMQLNVFEHLLI